MLSSEIMRAVAAERAERLRAEAERARARATARSDRSDRSRGGRKGGRGSAQAERKPALGPGEVYPDEPPRPTPADGRRPSAPHEPQLLSR